MSNHNGNGNSENHRTGVCRISYEALADAMRVLLLALASRLSGRRRTCLAPEHAAADTVVVAHCKSLIKQASLCRYHAVSWTDTITPTSASMVDHETWVETILDLHKKVDKRQTAWNDECSAAELLRHDRGVFEACRKVIVHYPAYVGSKKRQKSKSRRWVR